MWQRIQTLFLAVVIISLIVSIFMPIWVYKDASGQEHSLFAIHYTIIKDGQRTTQYFPYSLTAILAVAATVIALISIRKFKDRMLQMKLGALNSLFIAGTILCAVIFSNQMFKAYQGGQYSLGLWLPGVAVICNLIANRFIRRDERLVRDSNRLR